MALICPCRLYMTWSVRWTSLCATYFSYAWPHCSYVVRVCTFCDILWPEVQSHCEHSPVYAPGPRSACICICTCALTQARPTMSCIHLVPTLCKQLEMWHIHVTMTLAPQWEVSTWGTCGISMTPCPSGCGYDVMSCGITFWWCHVGQEMALWTASLYSDRVVSWLLNATISRL